MCYAKKHITLHLYYTSARAGQQGCLCLGTLCLEVKTGHNRSYSPLFCRSRKSVSVSCKDGPLSANSIFTPIPPMQKQYGFSTACKNRAIRSSRGERCQRPYRSHPAGTREPLRRCQRFSFVPVPLPLISR